jgi:hypothetical protein
VQNIAMLGIPLNRATSRPRKSKYSVAQIQMLVLKFFEPKERASDRRAAGSKCKRFHFSWKAANKWRIGSPQIETLGACLALPPTLHAFRSNCASQCSNHEHAYTSNVKTMAHSMHSKLSKRNPLHNPSSFFFQRLPALRRKASRNP